MKKTVLLPNEKKIVSDSLCRSVVDILTSAGASPYTFSKHSELFGDGVSYEDDENKLFSDAVLAVVLGGDGSIIKSARYCAPHGVPIVGVNLGRLGYLAQVEVTELAVLADIVGGKCTVESRIMLDSTLRRADGSSEKMYPALNDIVLSNGPVSRLMSFDISCDGAVSSHMKADGLIIATPTGSSAYSMSAGGPVLDPTLDCILTTPICAHTLVARPVVYSGSSVISIHNTSCRKNRVFLTVDGREDVEIKNGDVLEIRRSEYMTKLVRLSDKAFMNVLNRKMSDSV